ncbi:MAG: sulfite exporter TauE/SafE family protein [Verrucomicrobia bacterium]|jgi:hypothetical protein|nr:sulfite exporter TauE/SafE family protein [Verrucomicrobiota bacterium]
MITAEFLEYVLIGFAAQAVDGALGMAYGLTASSFLLATGLPPVTVSATVHMAETFTTGASAYSHHRFGNVNRAMFKQLLVPGVLGALCGAYLLTTFNSDTIKPWIALYILGMGLVVFGKAFRTIPPVKVATYVRPLGFAGAFVDALGGGGWGPIVSSTLLARGNEFRFTVGTVNAVEFFVTLTSSIVFIISLGASHWPVVLGLALGGVMAAPFAAWLCHRLPHKPMLAVVGIVICLLATRTLWQSLH